MSMQAPLQEAKAARIPTVGAGGTDCDVTGGPKLFSATVQNLAGQSAQQFWQRLGALQADWVVARTGGKATVLSLEFTDTIWGGWIQQGFAAELGRCAGCTVAGVVKIGNQDVSGGRLPQKFSTALLKQPTVNAVNVPLDGWFFAGLAQAVQSSGRSEKLSVIGSFGEPGNLGFIRAGTGEDAAVGFASAWTGWAGVDTLVRVLAGKPVQPAGQGLQVIDSDHNLPPAGQPFSYQPAVDYAAAYKRVWSSG
jgi:ribose transport system substrate-binding protein